MEGAQAAQAAQAILRTGNSRLKLRLLLLDTGKARRFLYLSLLILPLGYPLNWITSMGSTAAFGCAFIGWIGVYTLIKRSWPARFILKEGYLVGTIDSIMVSIGGRESFFPIDAFTAVEITYRGFKDERLTQRISASGFDNFIRLNSGETYRFEVLSEQAQENLRNELRRWYLLKVKVKEYRQDGPTFLLHRNLSYEQIQAYKQEFGVNLYG